MTRQITIDTLQDWHVWLEKHHATEKSVSLIIHKKHTGKSPPSHQALMHEAICFGWIDTTLKRLDDDRYVRNFAKRSKNSKWSDNTISYAKQLIKDGRMMPAGLHAYKEGLKKPTHDHGIPKNPNVPLDLRKALAKNKKAQEGFKSLAPSYRRTYLRWLYGAKLPETRQKRIATIVRQAEEKKKFGAK